jgi:hypothetical protein
VCHNNIIDNEAGSMKKRSSLGGAMSGFKILNLGGIFFSNIKG